MAPGSVTAALNRAGVGPFQWWLLGYTGLAWAADACETMLLSYLGPSAACAWPDTVGPFHESLLTSAVFAGMLIGVYTLGAASDALGRRKGFFLSAAVLGIAGLASAAAPSFAALLALRALVGAALGGTPIAVTLFAEFLPSARRGALVLLLQGAWTVGTAAEAALAWAVLPSLGWRWLVALSAMPMFVLLVGFPWLPESPHWLISKGRVGEATKVVDRVAAVNRTSDGPPLYDSTNNIDQSRSAGRLSADDDALLAPQHGTASLGHPPLAVAREDGSSHEAPAEPSDGQEACEMNMQRVLKFLQGAKQQFLSAHMGRTTALLWLIWFVNAITYYGLVLLTTTLQTARGERARCTPDGSPNFVNADYAAVLITAAAEAPGLLVAALFVDSKGRLWCIRVGMIACGISVLGLLGITSHWGQLALLFVSRACIEGTFSVLYVYTPELFPTTLRSFGLALCNGFSRIGGFAAPFATVYLIESGRQNVAVGLLGGLCVIAAGAALLLPFETRGRDLQAEIMESSTYSCTIDHKNGGDESSRSRDQGSSSVLLARTSPRRM